MPEKIAIIGAGLIGRAWAITFARGGCLVALYDSDPQRVEETLRTAADLIRDLEARAMLAGQTAAQVSGRITAAETIEVALEGVRHAQENVPEELEAKRAIFAELDKAAAPGTVLASSSSALLPSRFTETLAGRHRCLVAHPINPPYLVPAVELVPTPWTEPAIMERTRVLMSAIGQVPIVMHRELDGFIMNRLQGALLHEAFRLMAEGYASTDDIDAGICKGIGLRWAFMGPFETIDLNAPGGVRDYVARYEGLYRHIAKSQAEPTNWSGTLAERVEVELSRKTPRARLAVRQQWRDRRLMALARHLAQDEKEIGE
ncbi:MAG TPA: 3-hydroxyacyl-CoA dehydrogenase [Acetobacteraceae bacterium]|nr:3-hydroxyacyl-CoA dehydrogenase [Acetobacteraceae bacterium]